MESKLEGYALRLINKREYSEWELTQKLQKKFPEDLNLIKEVINNFKKNNYISDERFTQAFIRYQLLITQAGPHLVSQKLFKKGVESDLVQQKIEEIYTRAKETLIIKSLIEKKEEKIKNTETNHLIMKQKIWHYLSQKGFRSESIAAFYN